MSKKMFLKRSYAEVVREQPTANPFPPEPEHQVEEPVGEPGESVITPKMRIFGYVKTNTEVKKEVPKKKRKSKVRQLVKQLPDFEDDLDYIYISGENSSSAGSVSDNEDDMKVKDSMAPEMNRSTSPILIESNSNESDSEITYDHTDYYNDILDLPVLLRKSTGVSTMEAVDYILSQSSTSKVCKSVPYNISKNVGFLVSTSSVGHWKNIHSDGMGSWKGTGVKTKYIHASGGRMWFISEDMFGFSQTYMIKRYQFTNRSDPELHKIVIRATNSKGDHEDKVFVQYYFEKEEKCVKILPHGNSKKDQAFVRTQYTTLEEIKHMSKSDSKKPKAIFHEILETKGGVTGLKKPGEIARNRQQISDLKRNNTEFNEHDELKVLMDKIATEKLKEGNTFVFELTTDPELTLFVADLRQLKDLEIFCTNPANFCILGVDPTFNVGNYMVTLTSYRNLKVKNERGINPVMLGPVLIHQRKLEHSYFELPSKLIKHNQNLSRLLAFGTDGEHNLIRVFELFFPNALHLLCDLHMKDNIKSKLARLQITKEVATEYIYDIFGRDLGEERQPGLVDCMSDDNFDSQLLALKGRWTDRHRNGLEFYIYFLEEKAQLIKNHMTAEIRSMSGLGYPPIHYTQNANEALNSAFKSGLDKKLTLTECVNRLQHFIKQQEEEVNLSVISCGQYTVLPAYEHLKIPENKFYHMGEKSRKTYLKRFFQAEVVSKHRKQLTTNDQVCSSRKSLSISITECGVIKIPFEILETIYDNVERILIKQNCVVKAPGDTENLYFVASISNPSCPHLVRIIGDNGNIVCDEKCLKWKTYKICHHVLVVADSVPSLLKKFFEWYKKLKHSGVNLMSLTTFNLPKSRGKKATKATSVRKGPANMPRKEPAAYVQGRSCTYAKPALPDPPPGSYRIALLDFCNSNVSKCFGCQGDLKQNSVIPPPPQDMVIVSKMKRKFQGSDGTIKEGTLSNVYFHFNEQCVKSKDTYFVSSLLYCPEDLEPHLHDRHRDRLRNLGLSI